MIFRAARRVALAILLLSILAPAGAQDVTDDGLSVDTPLTAEPGNPTRGREIVRDASNATCLICHVLPIAEEPDPGDIGPPLMGVANRYSAGELRLRLMDPQRIDPESVMPGYYKTEGLYRVGAQFAGGTIYTAQEIEDVLAYLLTLTED
jgi:sulfur-oxidizing protein SoxX